MKFYRLSELPEIHPLAVYRQSSMLHWLLGICFIAFIAFAAQLQVNNSFLWFGLSLLCGAGCLVCLKVILSTNKNSNWLLQYCEAGLYIHFRSYLCQHLPADQPTVAWIPNEEIVSIGKATEMLEVLHTRIPSVQEHVYLDLRLKSSDFAQLAEHVKKEAETNEPKPLIGRSKHHHMPARIIEPDIFRLVWKGPQGQITPALDKAMLQMCGSFLFHPAQKIGRIHEQMQEDFENRFAAACKSGNILEAVKLVKERYALGTTQAKIYVEEFMAK